MKKNKVKAIVENTELNNRATSNVVNEGYFDYHEGDVLNYATSNGQVLAFVRGIEMQSFIQLHPNFTPVTDHQVKHLYNKENKQWEFRLRDVKPVAEKVKVVAKKNNK